MHPLMTPRHSDLANSKKTASTEPSSPTSPARPASAGTRTAVVATPPSARPPPSRKVAQRLLAASGAGSVPPAPPSSPANPAKALARARPSALSRQFAGMRLFQDQDAPPSPFSAPLPRAVKAVRVEEAVTLPRAVTAARALEPKSAALAAAPEQILKRMVAKASKLLEETDGSVLSALPYASLSEFQAATALASYDATRAPFPYEREAAGAFFAIAEKKPGSEGCKGVGVERGDAVLGVVMHNAIDRKSVDDGKSPREHQGLIAALRSTVMAMVSTGPKREEALRKAVNQDLIKQLVRGNKEGSGVSGFRFYHLPDTQTVEIDLSHGYKMHEPGPQLKDRYARMMANAILIAAQTPASLLPHSMAQFNAQTLTVKSVQSPDKPWMQEVADKVTAQVAAHFEQQSG